jgi:hypothetical protein
MGEVKSAYKMLVENPERRRQLGKPRNILEDNSKRVLKEVEFGVVDWVHVTQYKGPVVGSCEVGNETYDLIKFGEFRK